MIMALMRIDFAYAKGEEGEGEELEGVLEGGAVSSWDFGEERVLLAGFFIGRGL
jgi:hypothetical protein